MNKKMIAAALIGAGVAVYADDNGYLNNTDSFFPVVKTAGALILAGAALLLIHKL